MSFLVAQSLVVRLGCPKQHPSLKSSIVKILKLRLCFLSTKVLHWFHVAAGYHLLGSPAAMEKVLQFGAAYHKVIISVVQYASKTPGQLFRHLYILSSSGHVSPGTCSLQALSIFDGHSAELGWGSTGNDRNSWRLMHNHFKYPPSP